MNKWINIMMVSWFITAVVSAIAIVCGVIIREAIQLHPVGIPISMGLVFLATVMIIKQVYNKTKGR